MKKPTLLFACCIFLGATALSAQQITFSKVFYDPVTSTYGNSVTPAFDNGFMIAGETNDRGLILKIDSAGNYLWDKQIGTGAVFYSSMFNSIIPTNDSCFVLCGRISYTATSTTGAFIVKINVNGDTLWSSTIDNASGYAEALSIQQTIDSGYILTGYIFDNTPPNSRILVSKLDYNGNLQWVNVLTGSNNSNFGYHIKQTPDSGYMMIGYIQNNTPSSNDAFLVKLTSAGAISWSKKYNRNSPVYSSGNNLDIRDDGFLCYLTVASDLVLMKTDFSGNVLWSKKYSQLDINGTSMIRTSDSCYAFVTGTTFGGAEMLKVDSAGGFLWSKRLYIGSCTITESKDRGFLIMGNGPLLGIRMSSTFNPHIGLIKTDSLGNGVDCVNPFGTFPAPDTMISTPAIFTSVTGGLWNQIHPGVNIPSLVSDPGCVSFISNIRENNFGVDVTIYPNPTRNKITIETTVENGYLEVNDISGKLLMTHPITSTNFEIDLGELSNGLYFLTIFGNGFQAHRKVIKN